LTALAQDIANDARTANYPLARWYLRPLAARLAEALAATPVRPWHLTCCGLLIGLAAALLIATSAVSLACAALLVLLAWFCDRADGQLARRQETTSLWGAWFDANVDELLDVAWHVAIAAVVAESLGPTLAFALLSAFLGGKYLFMYGLSVEPPVESQMATAVAASPAGGDRRRLSAIYHAPANADVRVHLLIAALATGWLTAELVAVALYYNLRWIARYALVARRLKAPQGGAT
jgi:phosphatidylglycerophosphate synthase